MTAERRYPQLEFTCPELPEMAESQREAWCERCERKVHNLSAMTQTEQNQLLRAEPDSCVRYQRRIPVVVAVAMTLGIGLHATSGYAQDSDDEDDVEQLVTVQVTGGGPRGPWNPLFRESDPPELEQEAQAQGPSDTPAKHP